MARNYTVPIQDGSQAGDIVVVGIYGTQAVGTTPSGWTEIASTGTLCALYSRTVIAGDAGTSVDFPLGASSNKVACFVVGIRGATGLTARTQPSAGAVTSLSLTTNATATLIIAGCFSTLTQKFANAISSAGVNASGVGTNCPSVVYDVFTQSQSVTFAAGLSTALVGFELDCTGTAPTLYYRAATTEGDIP